MINRRALGLGVASLGLMGFVEMVIAPAWIIAERKGLRFGSAIGIRKGGFRDARMEQIIKHECAIYVTENEMKSYVVRDTPEPKYDFTLADELVEFAAKENKPMRGHTLFWAKDEYSAKWFQSYDFGKKPKVTAEALLRDYIHTVTAHFGDKVCSWDVVNEAIDEKTGDIRANVFTRILGWDAIRIAFEAARDVLPKTELVYNDYMSWRTKDALHRKGVLRLLDRFRVHKIPVDALGIQGHIGTDQSVEGDGASEGSIPQYQEWTKFLNEAERMGYDLMITEFDVNDRKVQGDIERRDVQVAQIAKTYLDITMDNAAVKDFLCWGMCDKYSWLQNTTGRDDKLPLRPTPFDENYLKKPLYWALCDAFDNMRSRKNA